jgi:hypothetical protein
MFRFTMKPSSGSHSRYLVKITRSVQCEYMEHSTHVSQVILCSHITDNFCTTSMYSHGTKCLILAKYRLWLPDDGFIVNRKMLERLPLF